MLMKKKTFLHTLSVILLTFSAEIGQRVYVFSQALMHHLVCLCSNLGTLQEQNRWVDVEGIASMNEWEWRETVSCGWRGMAGKIHPGPGCAVTATDQANIMSTAQGLH